MGASPRRRPGNPGATGDRLDYIADMVRQLEGMAAAADCRTLAALLDLAHGEAMRQRRTGRRRAAGGF